MTRGEYAASLLRLARDFEHYCPEAAISLKREAGMGVAERPEPREWLIDLEDLEMFRRIPRKISESTTLVRVREVL